MIAGDFVQTNGSWYKANSSITAGDTPVSGSGNWVLVANPLDDS